MFPFSECVVSFEDILFDDLSYLITTEKDKDDSLLQQSIADLGLLSPPILQASGPGTYRVVTGFRRLKALQGLEKPQISCRLLASTTASLTCLKISIADNAWQRPLNPGEQARAVYKLSLMIDRSGDLRRTAADLGLPSAASAVNNLLAVIFLPEIIFDYLSAGLLAFSTALSLTSVENQPAIELARLFTGFKLGGNRQRTAMSLIKEISAGESIPLEQVLSDIARQEIINDPKADRGLRSEQFFRYLRLRRFPHISRAEEDFAGKVKALNPGPRAMLTPPKDFEGDDYTLQLIIKNEKEIDDYIAFLHRIAASDLICKGK